MDLFSIKRSADFREASSDGPITVTLKSGIEAPRELVGHVMKTLEGMLTPQNAMALYELVALAKDPGHVPFGNSGDKIVKTGLVTKTPAGKLVMDPIIRDIVRASAEGEGFDVTVGSPLA